MAKSKKYIIGFSTISLCSYLGYSSFIISGEEKKVDFSFDPYVCFIDSTYYKSIEEALLDSQSGDVVQVIPGNKNRNSSAYTITTTSPSKKVIIPEGVTLSIPYELGVENNKVANSIDGVHALANRDKYCTSSVIIGNGITLENRGTIEIGGIIGAKGGGNPTGCTAGNYSELILGEKSILSNYGVLNVYGYIGEKVDGSAYIISRPMNNQITPTINMPMYWYDFGGGSALKAIYDSIGEYKCLPLDDFYFENIEAKTYLYGGTEIYTWVNLYASNNFGEYDLPILGSNDEFLINLPENSYIVSDFDSSTLLNSLDFYGNAKINDFSIDIKKAITNVVGEAGWAIASLFLPSKITSSEGYFPVSYHFQISLNSLNNKPTIVDGSENRFKFLNGSRLTISENVTFKAKEAIFYKGDDIYTNRGTHAKSLTKSKILLTPSTCIVNGKIIAEIIAGTLMTETNNAQLTTTTDTKITMYEPKAGTGNSFNAKMLDGENGWFYLPLSLKLMNETGQYEDKDLGNYISTSNEEFFYWNKDQNVDLLSVSIVSENGTSTKPGEEGKFNLSLSFSPKDHTSQILGYEWSVIKESNVGDNASFSSTNEDKTILTIPGNSSSSDDAFYTVTVKVRFLSSNDNLEHVLSNTLPFRGVKTESGGGCFSPETLILLANGTYAKAKNIKNDDRVISFNHFTGKLEVTGISYIDTIDSDSWKVLELLFDNNVKFEIITEHGLFDLNINKYVQINYENVRSFIGHEFALLIDLENVKIGRAKLVSYKTYYRSCKAYSIASAYNYNIITNSLVSIADGIDGLYNIFDYSENLMYDQKLLTKDIARYGLFSYEDLKKYLSKKEFDVFAAKYLKVSIGKGYITLDEIIAYIEKFLRR